MDAESDPKRMKQKHFNKRPSTSWLFSWHYYGHWGNLFRRFSFGTEIVRISVNDVNHLWVY